MPRSQADAKWRAPVLFCLGLIAAAFVVMRLDSALAVPRNTIGFTKDMRTTPLSLAPTRALTASDKRAAALAWRYIANNTQPETGLVNSVEGFFATTLWDQGSYVLALVAARRLGVLDHRDYDRRATAFLTSLAQLPLFEGQLPNKAYNTLTLAMVDYTDQATPAGIGWSAIDVGRMLMALRVLEYASPEFGPRIRAVLARWAFDALATDGDLKGTEVREGETLIRQEGRLGYEQYAARAAALWGADVHLAISASGRANWVEVGDVNIPIDLRDHRTFEAITPTLSEPYMLMALELGWNSESHLLASQVYRAQEGRYADTGTLTMVSEDHLNKAPYFTYASVYGNGAPWAVLDEAGGRHDDLRTVSLKAAYAWDALFDTDYTNLVVDRLQGLGSDTHGWAAGLYEADQSPNDVYTLNTNAVVLEALHFKAHGPLWSPISQQGGE